MKRCTKCGLEKALGDFRKVKDRLNAFRGECKICGNLASNLWRLKNYTPKIRSHSGISKPRSSVGNLKERARKKAYKKLNYFKIKAHKKVYSALKSGKLKKPEDCSICKIKGKRIHGHHENYYEPLRVVWVCTKCHISLHKNKILNTLTIL